jgi:hypothetical protein
MGEGPHGVTPGVVIDESDDIGVHDEDDDSELPRPELTVYLLLVLREERLDKLEDFSLELARGRP